jgi:prolyl-tRNA synthetase
MSVYWPKDAMLTAQQIEGAALIGIDVAKEDDLGEWYQQVITKGQMISYYDVCCPQFALR